MGIINVRTILVALPTLYLFVALFYMNGSSTRRTEFTRGSSPQTVMTVLRDSVVGKAAAPVPVVAPAPAPVPVQAAKPAAPAPPAAGSGTVAIPDAIPPALDAKTHPQAKVKFYDGNSVTVYGHPDQGQGGANWWPSVEREFRGNERQRSGSSWKAFRCHSSWDVGGMLQFTNTDISMLLAHCRRMGERFASSSSNAPHEDVSGSARPIRSYLQNKDPSSTPFRLISSHCTLH